MLTELASKTRAVAPDAPSIARILAGLGLATIGALLADWAHVPLAFMLGALFACLIGSVARWPIDVPLKLRSVFMSIVGLFLGQSFSPGMLDDIARWPISIALAVLYAPIGGACAFWFYARIARFDRLTAIFAAAPGGVSAVALFASVLGGDERKVALSQSLRISIVVVSAPLAAFGLLGYAAPQLAETQAALLSMGEATLLAVASLIAYGVLRAIGAPIPFLIGPLLACAALRMSGWISGELPVWLVEAALIVTGGAIGCRFHGVSVRDLARLAFWTVFGTLILIMVSALFALIAAALSPNVSLVAALLAFAPGGVAEMCLIAVALDADPGFVAAHHIARILFILLATPSFAAWLKRTGAVASR